MHVSIKLVIAAVMWSAAVALAVFRSIDHDPAYTVWSLLAGLVATSVSMWLALDLVVERIARDTIRRLQASDESSAERVASKITTALQEGSVSRLR